MKLRSELDEAILAAVNKGEKQSEEEDGLVGSTRDRVASLQANSLNEQLRHRVKKAKRPGGGGSIW